jgi:hypothetical protein
MSRASIGVKKDEINLHLSYGLSSASARANTSSCGAESELRSGKERSERSTNCIERLKEWMDKDSGIWYCCVRAVFLQSYMTFLCPICNEISSSKHEKFVAKKKGKTWRERKTERAVMTTVHLGFTCPCCKEVREMGHYNPFEAISKLGKKKNKPKLAQSKIVVKPKSRPRPEVSTLSPEVLVETIGFKSDANPLDGFRVIRSSSGVVSWNDATETRRLILQKMLLKAAEGPVITIQCFFRCWRARAKVRKVRELLLKKKKHTRA